MKTTTVYILASTNVPVSVDGYGFSAPEGMALELPEGVQLATVAGTLTGGDYLRAYVAADGSFYQAGELPNLWAKYWDGFGVGCTIAGFLMVKYVLRLLRRGPVTG